MIIGEKGGKINIILGGEDIEQLGVQKFKYLGIYIMRTCSVQNKLKKYYYRKRKSSRGPLNKTQ